MRAGGAAGAAEPGHGHRERAQPVAGDPVQLRADRGRAPRRSPSGPPPGTAGSAPGPRPPCSRRRPRSPPWPRLRPRRRRCRPAGARAAACPAPGPRRARRSCAAPPGGSPAGPAPRRAQRRRRARRVGDDAGHRSRPRPSSAFRSSRPSSTRPTSSPSAPSDQHDQEGVEAAERPGEAEDETRQQAGLGRVHSVSPRARLIGTGRRSSDPALPVPAPGADQGDPDPDRERQRPDHLDRGVEPAIVVGSGAAVGAGGAEPGQPGDEHLRVAAPVRMVLADEGAERARAPGRSPAALDHRWARSSTGSFIEGRSPILGLDDVGHDDVHRARRRTAATPAGAGCAPRRGSAGPGAAPPPAPPARRRSPMRTPISRRPGR